MLGPFNPPRNWHLGVWEAPKNNRFRAKNCHLWTFQKPHSDNFWGVKSISISPCIFHVMFSPQAALFKPFLAARDDYGKIWHFLPKMAISGPKIVDSSDLGLIYAGLVGWMGGGVKGSNRLSRMWHAIFNPFAALFNQFGAYGSLYGAKASFFWGTLYRESKHKLFCLSTFPHFNQSGQFHRAHSAGCQ